MTPRKYLVLAGIVFFGALGDICLKRGMLEIGAASADQWTRILWAPLTSWWVAAGVLLLLGFFAAYLSALSWADLTYVLPATALGYVVVALFSRWFLGEEVSAARWAGILLITLGVGFVSRGPSFTATAPVPAPVAAAAEAVEQRP